MAKYNNVFQLWNFSSVGAYSLFEIDLISVTTVLFTWVMDGHAFWILFGFVVRARACVHTFVCICMHAC